MVFEKLLIDRLAPSKSLVDTMPEPDAGLPELPAKINLFTVELGGEIDEADVQILDHASVLLDLFEYLLQSGSDQLAVGLLLAQLRMIHQHTTQEGYALSEALPLGLGLLIFGFEGDGVANGGLHLRKQLFGLLQREESGHPTLNAGNLDGQGAAAGTIELSEDDALPGTQKHRGVSHL